MNDQSLKEIFSEYRPDLGDSNGYMAELEKKLAVAEYFKKERRRLRITAITMFILGAVVGGIAVTFFLTHPVDVPKLDFIGWFAENLKTVMTVAVGCALLGYASACYLEKEEII